MTRLYSEGFEMQDTVGLDKFACYESTDEHRSGEASLNIIGSGTLRYDVNDLDELYFRIALKASGTNTTRAAKISWRNGSTVLGSANIVWTSSGYITLYVGTTAVAVGTISNLESNWTLIEVYVKIDDATGEITAKVEGIQDGTFSGDTKPGADTVIDNLLISNYSSGGIGANTAVYIDDFALNDTAGGVDDSWCGDGHIIVLKPNGDTATIDLTPSAAVDHYTLVDDIRMDGDTTYVEGSVVDEEDIYDLEACGLGEVVITRIWTEARARDTAATGKNIALITKASGGAEVSGGDVALPNSYTKKVLGAEEIVNPVDSAAWEVADIDALQGGVRTRS